MPGRSDLHAFDDDLLAAGQTFGDNHVFAVCPARLDPADRDLAVLDDKDVDALLVGDQGRPAAPRPAPRGPGLEIDRHQLAVDQLARGVRENGPDLHGVRRPVHRDVDEIDLAHRAVGRAVGKAQPHLYAGDVGRDSPPRAPASAARWLTGNRTYIGSWLTIVVSVPLCGLTTLPLVTMVRPILPEIGAMISV